MCVWTPEQLTKHLDSMCTIHVPFRTLAQASEVSRKFPRLTQTVVFGPY